MTYRGPLPIAIDSDAPLPINVQVAQQIKLLIAAGYLKPGDSLPTVVQLAKSLRLNHNTIASVYLELTKSSYLVAQRGKGTFVARTETVRQASEYLKFYQLLKLAFLEAQRLGINASDFGAAAHAQAVILKNRPLTSPQLAFVECCEHDTPSFLEAIKLEIGTSPEIIIELEALQAGKPEAISRLQGSDLVLTTSFHLQEVTQYALPNQEVISVTPTPDLPLLRQLATLPNAAQVLLVCRQKIGGSTLKKIVTETGIAHINLQGISLKELQNNFQQLQEFDLVYGSSLVYDLLRELMPQSEKLRKFSFGLSQMSAALLKARLGVTQLTLSDSLAATNSSVKGKGSNAVLSGDILSIQ